MSSCDILNFLLGRWVKIDSHQVPKPYFEHLIWKLGVHVNSVRLMCHKAQPCYQGATLMISYKIYQLDPLLDALEEQDLVPFHEKLLFTGNEVCEDSPTSLSAEDFQSKGTNLCTHRQ